MTRALFRSIATLIGVSALALAAACGGEAEPPAACSEGRTLNFAFYAFFEPVSSSANPDPDSAGFHEHTGYEADLLTALEAMDGAGLRFNRIPIAEWPGIWLLPATPDFDIAGGGITILDSRTRDAGGARVVSFTSGHIEFRHSLLVRFEDAARYATHDDLTSETLVGAIAGTTGEARLLQLTGLADSEGVLAAGTQIVAASGAATADGTAAYVITAGGSSPNVKGRERLLPPSPDMPVVIYLGADVGDAELIEALRDGSIDAFARGAIGNAEATGDGVFAVTALDPTVEYGGWTLSASEEALTACLDEKIDYLTNDQAIGHSEWRADPKVFLRRAQSWRP